MLEHILNSIDFYFLKLINQFGELKSYTFLTNNYNRLILNLEKYFQNKYDEFLETGKHIRRITSIEVKKEITYYNEQDYESNAKFFLDYFKVINRLISNIKNARNISYHQANFILIKKFLIEKSRFIILPTISYNYGYGNTPRIFKRDKLDYEKEIDDFDLFVIPYFNQGDIFVNCILAHEIGHYIEENYGLWDKIKVANIITDHVENIIKQEIEKRLVKEDRHNTIKKAMIRGDLLAKWGKRLRKWGKEIICDVIGLKLFGLSYFFAFVEVSFLTRPRSLGDEAHPPNWIRYHYMIKEIEHVIQENIKDLVYEEENGKTMNFGLKLIELIRFIKENFSKEQEAEDAFDKDVINLIFSVDFYDLIMFQINNLFAKEKIKEYSYKEHNEEIIYLMTLLNEYITPNELIIDKEKMITEPADIITILNAGWFFYLCKLKDHYKLFDVKENEFKEKAKILQRLNNLILKAVELSGIHKDAKEQLGKKKNA